MSQATGPLEKAVQNAVRKALLTAGVDVSNLSQVRRSMVRTGIGDLFLMHPKFGAAWFETKRQGAEQRIDQERFQKRCLDAGVPYIIGGLFEALRFLEARGLWRLPAGRRWEEFATPTVVHLESERKPRRARNLRLVPAP